MASEKLKTAILLYSFLQSVPKDKTEKILKTDLWIFAAPPKLHYFYIMWGAWRVLINLYSASYSSVFGILKITTKADPFWVNYSEVMISDKWINYRVLVNKEKYSICRREKPPGIPWSIPGNQAEGGCLPQEVGQRDGARAWPQDPLFPTQQFLHQGHIPGAGGLQQLLFLPHSGLSSLQRQGGGIKTKKTHKNNK